MSTLDAIQARADAATEGPWGSEELGSTYSQTSISAYGVYSLEMLDNGEYPGIASYPDTDTTRADAEFIAHAREDVPKLVAALRAVEAVCDAADGRDGPVFVGIMDTDEIRTAIREALG